MIRLIICCTIGQKGPLKERNFIQIQIFQMEMHTAQMGYLIESSRVTTVTIFWLDICAICIFLTMCVNLFSFFPVQKCGQNCSLLTALMGSFTESHHRGNFNLSLFSASANLASAEWRHQNILE